MSFYEKEVRGIYPFIAVKFCESIESIGSVGSIESSESSESVESIESIEPESLVWLTRQIR